MPDIVIDNIRLKELLLVVQKNKAFFDEFLGFLASHGYQDIHAFIHEPDEHKRAELLGAYFDTPFTACLYDGIARPYDASKSKWFFIAWLLRDAPQQRLQPILSAVSGGTTTEKKILILNRLIAFAAPLLPEGAQWQWHAIAEVMLDRLEGSRRALKGSLFEAIVRTHLSDCFRSEKLSLTVSPQQVQLHDETYDVEIVGRSGRILLPVKTRETMGGGHALLFTRDIHKSIAVAKENGFSCIPVVIAESWGGDLDSLPCDHFVYIPVNPNQVEQIHPLLADELRKLTGVFRAID
jgi:hypothetical protein